MSHGLKLLLIAAGAIITCIVVVVGFQLTKSGKSDTNKASEQFTSVMAEYDEIKLTCYNEMTVAGSDVITFIKENASVIVDDQILGIQVTTNGTGSGNGTQEYLSSDTNLTSTNKVKEKVNTAQKVTTAGNYINPTGKFVCTIERNENGMIEYIRFKQQ